MKHCAPALRRFRRAGLALLLLPGLTLAQNVAITNARIIVGNGDVHDRGTIIVRDGRITEVTTELANTLGLTTIDANGLTAMPGLIDAHRHINTGPNEREEMQAQLEAGYTTILSGGGPAETASTAGRSRARGSYRPAASRSRTTRRTGRAPRCAILPRWASGSRAKLR
jgi:imidazolonepropionase-like amidohydrolase